MNLPTPKFTRFWRTVQFPTVRILIGFVWVLVVVSLVQAVLVLLPQGMHTAVTPLIALAACLGYYSFVRLVEKRPVSELGLNGLGPELGAGVLLGAALFTLTIGIIWALGFYQVTAINPWVIVIPEFMSALLAGFIEEILIRALLFRILEEWLGSWLALLITAVIFGALHLANPGATPVSALAIALEAGIMLAAAYMLTRRLWLAIGIHFAWNFTQGGIFGVAVSGNQSLGLLQSTLSGPALLSGGEFGVEASLFAVIVCLTAGLYLLFLAYKKGHFIKPFWRRKP